MDGDVVHAPLVQHGGKEEIAQNAADIIKLAMVKVFTRLKKEALQARLIMQVHDELIVECPEDEAERVKALLAAGPCGGGTWSPRTRPPGPSAPRRPYRPSRRGTGRSRRPYSQIELRLLAHISGDQAMQEAFLSGEDFHTVTAAHVFGVPIEQVTANMRRAAEEDFPQLLGGVDIELPGVGIYLLLQRLQRGGERFAEALEKLRWGPAFGGPPPPMDGCVPASR